MLVQVGDEQYVIPMGVIDEIALLTPDRVKNLEKSEAMLLRGRVLPLVRLSELLGRYESVQQKTGMRASLLSSERESTGMGLWLMRLSACRMLSLNRWGSC